MGETNNELERIFNSYRYQVKKYVVDHFIYLHCLKCVLMKATCEREIFKLFTGLPVRPSHKFGFRSSVSKSGLPGEGRHEGLVPRNGVLTNGFRMSFSCTEPYTDTFCTLSALPLKNAQGVANLFDHGSNSIIFLLFEFKSVR